MKTETKTLEELLSRRKNYTDEFVIFLLDKEKFIDSFKLNINDYKKNLKFHARIELLFYLLSTMCELELMLSFTTQYADTLPGKILLFPQMPTFLRNVRKKLFSLKSVIEKVENIYDKMNKTEFKINSLTNMDGQLDENKNNIFKATSELVDVVRKAIYLGNNNYAKMTAEEIKRTFNDMLAHYESDNAQVLENYLSNVIDPKESLRDLNKERDCNETVKLWSTKPEPYKFIKTLREQDEKDELDLLPVFDYIAKYKRLQEMINPTPTSDVVCLPPMLSVEKTKELYLLLRENAFIENSLSEEDFLQLFGIKKSSKVLAPVKWLANKNDLLLLLQGIYQHWSERGSISQTKLKQIAHARFVNKKGEHYSTQMKIRESYKGENLIISDFLATL